MIKPIVVGEKLRCLMCDREGVKKDDQDTNWRKVSVGDRNFYACPDEFPSDEKGSVDDFQKAYLRFLNRVISLV